MAGQISSPCDGDAGMLVPVFEFIKQVTKQEHQNTRAVPMTDIWRWPGIQNRLADIPILTFTWLEMLISFKYGVHDLIPTVTGFRNALKVQNPQIATSFSSDFLSPKCSEKLVSDNFSFLPCTGTVRCLRYNIIRPVRIASKTTGTDPFRNRLSVSN